MTCRKCISLVVIAIWMCVLGASHSAAQQTTDSSGPKVHTYYIAVDEVEWDYAPSGINQVTGKPFDKMEEVYTQRGPHRIGQTYTYTYTWLVPERAGPGPGDLSSVVWLYHSHVNEQKEVDAGLVGAIPSSYREWASEGPRKACNSCR